MPLLLMVVKVSFAQEVSITAQINTPQAGVEDYFQLTYSIHNAQNIGDFTPPSFKGFQVIGAPSQSSSSQISIVNGKRTSATTYNINFILKADKVGNYTFAPATVEVDGKKLSSNTVSIEIVKGTIQRQQQQNDPFSGFWGRRQQPAQQQQPQDAPEPINKAELEKLVFIKVEVDKREAYVGEQITTSYKLYTSLPMSVSLSQLPSLNGFWSEDFNIPKVPKPTEEIINGKKFQVFLLKKSALFPQQAGNLILDEAKAEGVVRILRKTKGRHPFADDPFFSFFMDDPFFDNNIFSRHSYEDVPVKLSSKPTVIKVKPLPTNNQPEHFTGGVGQFELKAQLDKDSITTDEAATLTLTISGSGNFKLMGNPIVHFPEALGVFDPEVKDTILSRNPSITGKKTLTYNINPQEPGVYEFGPINFSYYDVQSNSYKTLKNESYKINVQPGVIYKKNNNGNAITASGDINELFLNAPNWYQPSRGWISSYLYWFLYLLPLFLFGFLWYRKKQNDFYENNAALLKNKKANKIAWKRLSTARQLLQNGNQKDFYEAISKAIWLYLSDKLSIPISELSKENIGNELTHKNIDNTTIDQIKTLINDCEIALYSPLGAGSQKQKTLDQATSLISGLEIALKENKKAKSLSVSGVTSVFLIGLFLLLQIQVFANDRNSIMLTANELYQNKNYEEALLHYEQLIEGNNASVELYYNLANTYYKLHKVGYAILYYQKALHIEPNNKSIKENLTLAQQKINKPIPNVKPLFIINWWQNLVTFFSPNAWAFIAFVFFIGVVSFVYLLVTENKKTSNTGRWLSLMIALFLLSILLSFQSKNNKHNNKLAVVMSDTASVTEQPNNKSKNIATAPEGTTLIIIDRQDGYLLIELPNGRRGWIKNSDINKV